MICKYIYENIALVQDDMIRQDLRVVNNSNSFRFSFRNWLGLKTVLDFHQ